MFFVIALFTTSSFAEEKLNIGDAFDQFVLTQSGNKCINSDKQNFDIFRKNFELVVKLYEEDFWKNYPNSAKGDFKIIMNARKEQRQKTITRYIQSDGCSHPVAQAIIENFKILANPDFRLDDIRPLRTLR